MKTEQNRWTKEHGWTPEAPGGFGERAQLVFAFGGRSVIKDQVLVDTVKQAYPHAHLMGCSTAGEISGTQVFDDSLIVTAIEFEHTRVEYAHCKINDMEQSFQVGEQLAQGLKTEGLVHVLVLSDGLHVNGSDLVAGLVKHLPASVTITGGLSGDADRFEETVVLAEGVPATDMVAVVGLYGERLQVGYGSLGGWDSFGPERLITRSKGNVLYELDGRSALQLYKTYLGDHAKNLPAAGLLFPLSLRTDTDPRGVVRTILSVNENEQSMTFAGDVPKGAYARLMKANFDRLIDGAEGAAKRSYEAIGSTSPDFALLISCVGRKLILKQRIEEEVEGVRDILGERTLLAGFYSYGEISPFTPGAKCELHNQTMTITTLSEA